MDRKSSKGYQDIFALKGKVILITGACGGFGSAIVKGVTSFGADVAITDIRQDALDEMGDHLRDKAVRVWTGICDINDDKQITHTVSKVIDEFKRIDVLIDIAGCAVLKPAIEMSKKEFEQTVNSCLGGSFSVAQLVGKHMIENSVAGSIIFMSSIAASQALGRGTGAYAAAKASLNALMRELAVEWAPHGLRVNALAPCQFRTTGLEKVLDDSRFGGREALAKRMLSKIPIGRFGETDEIVGPCLFLASEASSMVTGQVLYVDGGYTAQ